MNKMNKNKYGRIVKVNETTQAQKAVAAVHGSNKNIKNFCIISPQNPMYAVAYKTIIDENGKEKTIQYNTMSSEENEKRMETMRKELRRCGYRFYSVLGRYDIVEKSVIIYNITLEACISFAEAFDQESFIVGEVNEPDDRFVTFSLYVRPFSKTHVHRKGEEPNVYKKVDDETKLIDLTNSRDADEYFTEIGKKMKFNVPFSYFNEEFIKARNEIDLLVESRKANYPLYAKNYDDLLEGAMTLAWGGRRNMECRGILYWGGIDKYLDFFDISNQGRKADLEEQRRAK